MISWLSKCARDALNSRFRKLGYSLRWIPPAVLSQPGQVIEVDFSMLAAQLNADDEEAILHWNRSKRWSDARPALSFHPRLRMAWHHGRTNTGSLCCTRTQLALGFQIVTLVEAAVGLTDSKGTIYSVEMSNENSMMMSLHSSFSKDILLRASQWHPNLESHIIEREITIISFPTLLSKAKGQTVDVLKIDTEGYDLEILKSIDLSHFSPKLILAEHANLSQKDQIKMATILLDHGISGNDDISRHAWLQRNSSDRRLGARTPINNLRDRPRHQGYRH